MKKIIPIFLIVITMIACSEDDIIKAIIDTSVTAKENIPAVMEKARADMANDVQLSMIYARNIETSGEIDLADFSAVKGFIYKVNSESQATSEFYIPNITGVPVKSPVNLTDVLALVKDAGTRTQLEDIFNVVDQIDIASNASYRDSDATMNSVMSQRGNSFINQNSNTQIDMFLVPSKAITLQGLQNSADWIVHFYNDANSLVLWVNSSTGIITEL